MANITETVIGFYTDDLPDISIANHEKEKLKALNMAIEMIEMLEGMIPC